VDGAEGLKAQFGWDYERIRKFREIFVRTLRLVHTHYQAARFDLDAGGMTLRHSPPLVKGRIGITFQALPTTADI
jgi:hypothetical protein